MNFYILILNPAPINAFVFLSGKSQSVKMSGFFLFDAFPLLYVVVAHWGPHAQGRVAVMKGILSLP